MDKIDYVIEIIKNWSEYELVSAWNERCDAVNDYDSRIEFMDSFDDLMSGKSPLEIANMVSYGDFRSGDDFFAFNGYGNIKTFSYADDDYSPFGYFDLAEYLIENGDSDTKEVNTDSLVESFEEWFINNRKSIDNTILHSAVEALFEEGTFDLLTDDWAILADDVEEKLDEMANEKK